MDKRILCVDMDAFFASVEQASRPYLKNIPMAVIGKGERTIILSASYKARLKGVRTGQTLKDATMICPGLKLVIASNKKYSYISGKIADFLKTITPTATMYSVDEAFLDITKVEATSEEIAFEIKEWLKCKLGITGSVGIANSYILAKMASDVRKPDGYYEVKNEEIITFIDGFKLKDIWGIGKKTVNKLNRAGLFTPSDIRNCGKDRMIELFGITGENIYLSCCGIDRKHNIRKEETPHKSISHSVTSPRDIYNVPDALAYLLQLSEMVSARARQKGYAGKCVTLVLKDTLMQTKTYRKSLSFYTSATHHIYENIKNMFFEHHTPFYPLRLVGVSLNELVKNGAVLNNMEDFLCGNNDKYIKLYKVLDEINSEHTDGLIRGSALRINFRRPQVISPNYDVSIIYE